MAMNEVEKQILLNQLEILKHLSYEHVLDWKGFQNRIKETRELLQKEDHES